MRDASSCPYCNLATDNIRDAQVSSMLFLIHHFFYRTEMVRGCPRCLRSILFRRTCSNALAANIMLPMIALLNALEYFKTYRDPPPLDTGLTEEERELRWQRGKRRDIILAITLAA